MWQLTTNHLALLVLAAAALLWLITQGRIPLAYNLRNLAVRWKTTVMTGLAFTLVIGLLVVMLAFVNGMYALTENSGQPGNVIILSEGATDESFSNLGFSDIGDIENQPGVLRDNSPAAASAGPGNPQPGDPAELGRPLCSRETYIVINQPIVDPLPGRPKRRFLQVRGLDDPLISATVHNVTVSEGGAWFSAAGVRQMDGAEANSRPAIEVVLGAGIAGELGRDRNEAALSKARNRDRLDVGDSFSLGERQWLVVGVMESSGSTFDSEVWAKRSVVGPLFGKQTYTSLVLRTGGAQTAQKLKDFFNNEFTKAAVQALTEKEYFNSLAETNRQFLFGIVFVAVVLAIGGLFGVMNTMFAAISQRTRDIGVLRLLGFARWQILVCFLLESLLLAALGGAVGCLLGSLVDGWTATSVVSSGQGGGGKFVVLKLSVDSLTILAAMLLSLAMGLAGGLLPALSAVRLRPLIALR